MEQPTPPEGTPCARPPEKVERLRAWIKEMAPEHYDRIRIPETRQYSFHAFEALEFAYDAGLDFQFKTALYDMMWTEGRDIGEPETLLEAAQRVGLDPGARRRDDRPRLRQRTLALKQARETASRKRRRFTRRTRTTAALIRWLQSVMEKRVCVRGKCCSLPRAVFSPSTIRKRFRPSNGIRKSR